MRYQRAAEFAFGMEATSTKPLDLGWADAVARYDSQVQEIHFLTNADRSEIRAMNKVRTHG